MLPRCEKPLPLLPFFFSLHLFKLYYLYCHLISPKNIRTEEYSKERNAVYIPIHMSQMRVGTFRT